MRRIIGTTIALLLLTPLAGCGREDQPAPEDYPEGAVQLRQNIPTPWDDYTLTAINIEGDKGIVVVEPPDGGHVNVPATAGDTASEGGLTFEVLDVVAGEGDGDEPGAGAGEIVILPGSS